MRSLPQDVNHVSVGAAPAPAVSASPGLGGLLSQHRQGKANWICSAELQGHVLQMGKGAPICPYQPLGFGALLCLRAGADEGENATQNLHFSGNRNESG